MNKDIKHVAIAEIYKAVDKIRDFTNTMINASEAEKHAIIMYCDYIQNCGKMLHDELYPQKEEGEQSR